MIAPDRLAAFEAGHQKAIAGNKPTTAASWRYKARKLAAELGVPVPAWATELPSVKRERSPKPPKALATEAEPAEVVPFELPPALRQWREAQPGRVVNVRRDGSVRLIIFTDSGVRQEARFSDANHAARALMLGVSWRALAKVDTRPRTASGRVRQHSAVG